MRVDKTGKDPQARGVVDPAARAGFYAGGRPEHAAAAHQEVQAGFAAREGVNYETVFYQQVRHVWERRL